MESSNNPAAADPIDGPETHLTEIITSPIRASRHIAIWLVWHSVGVSLVDEQPED